MPRPMRPRPMKPTVRGSTGAQHSTLACRARRRRDSPAARSASRARGKSAGLLRRSARSALRPHRRSAHARVASGCARGESRTAKGEQRPRAGGQGGFRLPEHEPEASHELQIDELAPGVGRPSDRGGGVFLAERSGSKPQPRVDIPGHGPSVRASSCRHRWGFLLVCGRQVGLFGTCPALQCNKPATVSALRSRGELLPLRLPPTGSMIGEARGNAGGGRHCDEGGGIRWLHRSLAAALVVVGVVALAPGLAAAQSAAETPALRTAWGDPALSGIWDFRSITPLQRPVEHHGARVPHGGRGGGPRAGECRPRAGAAAAAGAAHEGRRQRRPGRGRGARRLQRLLAGPGDDHPDHAAHVAHHRSAQRTHAAAHRGGPAAAGGARRVPARAPGRFVGGPRPERPVHVHHGPADGPERLQQQRAHLPEPRTTWRWSSR